MDRRADFPNYPNDGDDKFPEVIEPYSLWHIAMYWDYGGAALWDMNSYGMSCTEYGPFEAMEERLSAWSGRCEDIAWRQWATDVFKEDAVPREEKEAVYQEGLQLCAELAETLHGKCRTIDYSYKDFPPKRFFVPDPPEYLAADSLA